MARIIKNLRTYARGGEITSWSISLNQALDDAISLLEGQIHAEGVELNLTLPEDHIMVRAGTVRLQQVFVNIMSNAIDAMRAREKK